MDNSEFRKKIKNPADAVEVGFKESFSAFKTKNPSDDKFEEPANRLKAFFYERNKGPGIWKLSHYFDIYDRHFRKFCGREVHILEIGIYSGGSLDMWKDYFGPKCHIYGVDISPRCKSHERQGVKVFIGDQSDPVFWADFRKQVPRIDIVVDDGSHAAYDQVISIEQLLPHVSPGGVYLVEDLTGSEEIMNSGASYIHGLAHRLNGRAGGVRNDNDPKRLLTINTNALQRAVGSIHLYPFVAVIERNATDVTEIISSRQGTVWEPPEFWQAAWKASKKED
jgi:hypothetical protein